MHELWRGNANAWECDELGHMNVQFYLAKATEAIGNLARLAGLGGVFRSDTYATLAARSIHIKFLAEARPGAPLVIHGGLTGYSACSADAVLIMSHGAAGQPAASFRVELEHVSPSEARPFAWPGRFVEAFAALQVETPALALARGVQEEGPAAQASLVEADRLGLQQIGMGCFGTAEIGPFGRIRTDVLLGRVSQSGVNFEDAFPEEVAFHREESDARIGSALLETRIIPRRWPRAGDAYIVRSGLKSLSGKVRNLVHWVLDPASGKPWWTMEGVAGSMDLDARRLVAPTGAMLDRLEQALKPDLRA